MVALCSAEVINIHAILKGSELKIHVKEAVRQQSGFLLMVIGLSLR
jgi:hypothetical protein